MTTKQRKSRHDDSEGKDEDDNGERATAIGENMSISKSEPSESSRGQEGPHGEGLGIRVLAHPWGQDVDFSVHSTLLSSMVHLDEQFQHAMHYQFDATSGYLYDASTQLYYVPNHNLYYQPSTSSYYAFVNGEYQYHSTFLQQEQPPKSSTGKEKAAAISGLSDKQGGEGDASDASAEGTRFMCLIVLESPSMEKGQGLPISTTGVILGRQDAEDVISVPDKKLSRRHCFISYRPDVNPLWPFALTDMGSRNGTFLNDERLSTSGKKSDATFLMHGDIIAISETELQAHIHEKSGYCFACRHVWQAYFQPGSSARSEEVQVGDKAAHLSTSSRSPSIVSADPVPASNRQDAAARLQEYVESKPNTYQYVPGESFANKSRAAHLAKKQLKRELMRGSARGVSQSDRSSNGHEDDDDDERRRKGETRSGEGPLPAYKDRAAMRRRRHGTLCEGDISGSVAHIDSACPDRAIPVSNKGSQLLKKIGWTGTGLGKDEQGRIEPVRITKRKNRQGLG